MPKVLIFIDISIILEAKKYKKPLSHHFTRHVVQLPRLPGAAVGLVAVAVAGCWGGGDRAVSRVVFCVAGPPPASGWATAGWRYVLIQIYFTLF